MAIDWPDSGSEGITSEAASVVLTLENKSAEELSLTLGAGAVAAGKGYPIPDWQEKLAPHAVLQTKLDLSSVAAEDMRRSPAIVTVTASVGDSVVGISRPFNVHWDQDAGRFYFYDDIVKLNKFSNGDLLGAAPERSPEVEFVDGTAGTPGTK